MGLEIKKNLSVFDKLFTTAQMNRGMVCDEHLLNLENFVAIKLWRGLGSSVSPKIHAIKDHFF
jgi:hypothetical protein